MNAKITNKASLMFTMLLTFPPATSAQERCATLPGGVGPGGKTEPPLNVSNAAWTSLILVMPFGGVHVPVAGKSPTGASQYGGRLCRAMERAGRPERLPRSV